MENKPAEKKIEEHKPEQEPSYLHSKLYPSAKPTAKCGSNIILQRETWILIAGVLIALTVITVIFTVLWGKFIILFYWVIGTLAIFLTRKTDMWYVGVEIHFGLAFYTAYAFGPLFAFSMILVSYAGVWKIRPDQGHGVMIQVTTLSLMILLSLIMKYIYGAKIGPSQFLFAAIFCIVLVQLIDGVISKMFCPTPLLKIIIIHSCDMLLNVYVAKVFGYKILMYLLSLAA